MGMKKSIASMLLVTSVLISFASCKKSEVSDSGLADASANNSASDEKGIDNANGNVDDSTDGLGEILSSDEVKLLLDDTFSFEVDEAFSKYSSTNFLDFESSKLALLEKLLVKAGCKVNIDSDNTFIATKGSDTLQLGGQLPDNKFTKMVSLKFGKMLHCITFDNLFSSSFFIVEDDFKSFIENVKESSFNKNITETKDVDGDKGYCFEATNDDGFKLNIQSKDNILNVVISK